MAVDLFFKDYEFVHEMSIHIEHLPYRADTN